MVEFFEITFGNILTWVITLFGIGAFAWGIFRYQRAQEKAKADMLVIEKEQEAKRLNQIKLEEAARIKAEKEVDKKDLERYTDGLAVKVEQVYETKHATLIHKIDAVAADVKTQIESANEMIRGLDERQGFTNSNMAEMSNMILDGQEQNFAIIQALEANKIVVEKADPATVFKAGMLAKRAAVTKREDDQAVRKK